MSENWTTDTEDQGGVGRGCYVAVVDENRESVAHVRCYDHSLNDLPYRERAHLIASAPELYETANRLSILCDEIWVQMSDGEMDLCKEAWKAMDAALAKARGEQ